MDESTARTGRKWVAFAAVLALIPAVPIVVAVVLGARSVRAETVSGDSYRPVAPAPPATPAKPTSSLPAGSGAVVAIVRKTTSMRSAPDGPRLARIGTRTTFNSPQVVWVVRESGNWLGVVSSDAGNGRIGWIERSVTSLGRVPWELRVSLGARRLTVIDDGQTVKRFTVAVGRPSAPTPTGRFAVTDRLQTGDPNGPYGCCILALSARSPHEIEGWNGGDRIAIHSTPETGSIGLPVSHGCLRLTLAEGRWLLDHVPLGTPTIITA
ncbi:MAG: L,D-transpeptidase [Solirubrobacterales bacterium]|nr:L,D-transpeptidase [Solirubrobacterales bacterium]MBV9918427.1 L,D-transpeptidase [Solirubrobacterales bacterium]